MDSFFNSVPPPSQPCQLYSFLKGNQNPAYIEKQPNIDQQFTKESSKKLPNLIKTRECATEVDFFWTDLISSAQVN